MIQDNWIHRSKGMTCGSCMYFVNYRCRRHAPTMSGWPAVHTTDNCGDHKLDKEEMARREMSIVRSIADTHASILKSVKSKKP